MIYEMITYDLMQGSVPEVERRLASAYEHRKQYSTTIAAWKPEIGPLNEVIEIWPYADIAERQRVANAVREDPKCAAGIDEYVKIQHSDVFNLFPFCPDMTPGDVGPFFEMRIYTYASGNLPALFESWEPGINWRKKFGAPSALLYSEIGRLNTFVHIWPYRSLNERMEIREKSRSPGLWPPARSKPGGLAYSLVHQENRILMPMKHSPLR